MIASRCGHPPKKRAWYDRQPQEGHCEHRRHSPGTPRPRAPSGTSRKSIRRTSGLGIPGSRRAGTEALAGTAGTCRWSAFIHQFLTASRRTGCAHPPGTLDTRPAAGQAEPKPLDGHRARAPVRRHARPDRQPLDGHCGHLYPGRGEVCWRGLQLAPEPSGEGGDLSWVVLGGRCGPGLLRSIRGKVWWIKAGRAPRAPVRRQVRPHRQLLGGHRGHPPGGKLGLTAIRWIGTLGTHPAAGKA
jgi:hypothetical protein